MKQLFEVSEKESQTFSLFDKNGMMEPLKEVKLHRGCRVLYAGYAMNTVEGVIVDEEMNAVAIYNGKNPSVVDEYETDKDGYSLPIKWKMDNFSRSVENIHGIGTYYYTDNIPVSDETIEASMAHKAAVETAVAELERKKKEESEKTKKRLACDYGYLEMVQNRFEHKTVGKNIRTELKRNFPETKFSVRYDSFTGGNEYSITWTDGPTRDAVEKIVDKYQDSHSDYTGDYFDYDPSEFNELFGGVKYVLTQREHGANFKLDVCEKYEGLNENTYLSYQKYPKDFNMFYGCGYGETPTFEKVVYNLWHQTDLTKKAEKENKVKAVKKEASQGKLEIVDYSEKAFAVVGDTYQVKDALKKLGGTFNARLKCGAGWIFSKKKEAEVRRELNLL